MKEPDHISHFWFASEISIGTFHQAIFLSPRTFSWNFPGLLKNSLPSREKPDIRGAVSLACPGKYRRQYFSKFRGKSICSILYKIDLWRFSQIRLRFRTRAENLGKDRRKCKLWKAERVICPAKVCKTVRRAVRKKWQLLPPRRQIKLIQKQTLPKSFELFPEFDIRVQAIGVFATCW